MVQSSHVTLLFVGTFEPIKSFSGLLFQTADQIFQFHQTVSHIRKVSKSNYLRVILIKYIKILIKMNYLLI